MGWLIALGILILLAVLPLGAGVKYDAAGPLVKIIVGPVRFTVYPRKKKEKKPKEEKKPDIVRKNPQESSEKKPIEKPSQPAPPEKTEQKGGSITDFLPLVRVALDLLGDLRRKLRVNRLEVKLILGGDDPCDLAVNYGRAWEAVGNLFPLLERAFVIKKRDVEVECDFTADETLVIARLDITITLGRLIALAVRYGIRALREYLKIMNSRKGGAYQ